MDSVRQAEYEWLDTARFNWDDFSQWRLENPDPVTKTTATGDSKSGTGDTPKGPTEDPTQTPTGPSSGDQIMQELLNKMRQSGGGS
jgi:hypothetical protein